MKLKQIVVNKKLERELQNNDIYVEELCFEENKLDVLVLTKKDIKRLRRVFLNIVIIKGMCLKERLMFFKVARWKIF